MADQRKRGGMKQGTGKNPQARKHQGQRPGSTATAKERAQKQPRQKVI